MRRTRLVFALFLTAPLATGGCATFGGPEATDHPHHSRSGDDRRQPVPDAVMLRDHVGSQYRDTPVP